MLHKKPKSPVPKKKAVRKANEKKSQSPKKKAASPKKKNAVAKQARQTLANVSALLEGLAKQRVEARGEMRASGPFDDLMAGVEDEFSSPSPAASGEHDADPFFGPSDPAAASSSGALLKSPMKRKQEKKPMKSPMKRKQEKKIAFDQSPAKKSDSLLVDMLEQQEEQSPSSADML